MIRSVRTASTDAPLENPTVHTAAAESIERAAMQDLYRAAAVPGVEAVQFGPAMLLLCPHGPPLLCNRLLADAPLDADVLGEAIRWAGQRQLPWAVSLGPGARGLDAELQARGFRPGYAWMKFSRGVTDIPDARTELRVALASPADRDKFAAIAASCFALGEPMRHLLTHLPGRDRWRCYLAWNRDEPVAAAATFLLGDAAWIGFAATMPSHRRLGAQGALLAARIRDAAACGANTVYVETGERAPGKPDHSYRNLLRAGFQECYLRPNLVCPGFEALRAPR
jgi:GNAT superfamily N-acetyltransferase